MSYRLTGTDPFFRAAIGAFNGYAMEDDALSVALLVKRRAVSAWHGLYVVDNGSTGNYTYGAEFNPSNQMAGGPDGVTVSVQTFNDTTNWMIVGFTRDATTTWTWRWKIGSGAWSNEGDTWSGRVGNAGSGYRQLIGNEAGLGDDADFDICCVGAIKSNLSQASFESLTMTDFASWQAVFTGAGAWLIGFDTIATQLDRTGNGGDELSRSAGITLVADPAPTFFGTAAQLWVPRRMPLGV